MPTPGGSRTALAWTPDGRELVFVGSRAGIRQVYVRRLDRSVAWPVPGTEGARAFGLSADGRWVAFVSDGKLKKVPLEGGPAAEVAAGVSGAVTGLTWDAAGDLYYDQSDGRIWRAAAAGGSSKWSARPRRGSINSTCFRGCCLAGAVLLYTVRRQHIGWGEEEVVAQTLATGRRKPLLRNAADARFVASRYFVFMRRGTLLAVVFDPDRLEVSGTPVPVMEGVAQALVSSNGADLSGAGQFAVASTGSLAWVPGPPPVRPAMSSSRSIAADGVRARGAAPELCAPVRLSPDGRKLGVAIQDFAGERPWTYDLDRGTLGPIRGDGEASWPLWSPDGQRVVYDWLKDGRWSLVSQRADGTRAADGPRRRKSESLILDP